MVDRSLSSRIDGALIMAIVLVVLGTLFGETSLLLAATVPIGYLSIAWVARPPAGEVAIKRDVTPNPVAPGERVTVTLTIRNEGDATLPDIRVVDGVPANLSVEDGSPRACLAIRPGETESITYTLVASHGTHEFDPILMRARSLSAAAMRTERIEATGATALDCRRDAGTVPQMGGSLRRVGTRQSDRAGDGMEFHSTREYHPGDDIRRIDWRRFAKTDTLTTIQFAETSATETVVIVDRSATGRVARAHGYPTANELTVYAADRVTARLFNIGHDVGLCALGVNTSDIPVPVASTHAGHPWIAPGADDSTRVQIDAVFDTLIEQTRGGGSAGGAQVTDLHTELPTTAAVVLVTPALDDSTVELVSSLSATARELAVISPDVTDRQSPGRTVARTERSLRLTQVQATGAMVYEWDTRLPLTTGMEAIQ